MALSLAQQKIAADTARFRVVMAGRRFGKTHLAIREICKAAAMPDQEVWFVSPTYRQCKQNVWKKLKNKIVDLRWASKINESELSILLKNGSSISLKGADNYDGLRGVGLDFLVMDEFADTSAEAWYETLRPTLSDREGRALFIGTPKGRSNWSYDMFQQHLANPDNWSSYQFTTIDGGRVKLEEIEAAKRDLDIRVFNQEYNATFETFSGRVFYSFDDNNIKPFTEPTPDVLYLGMDFNIDPMSVMIGTKQGEIFHIFDEIQIFGSNTQEAIDEIKNRYGKQRIVVYPDPAGHQRKTSANGRTDITQLQNAGFRVVAPYSHNPVRDGINAVNSRILSASGERRLLVDGKCKHTIKSLERMVYKTGTSVPNKEQGLDHMADAIRYCIDGLWPIKREIEQDQNSPTTWAHTIGR